MSRKKENKRQSDRDTRALRYQKIIKKRENRQGDKLKYC